MFRGVLARCRDADFKVSAAGLEDLFALLSTPAALSPPGPQATQAAEVLGVVERCINDKASKVAGAALRLVGPAAVLFHKHMQGKLLVRLLACLFPKLTDTKAATRSAAQGALAACRGAFSADALCMVRTLRTASSPIPVSLSTSI